MLINCYEVQALLRGYCVDIKADIDEDTLGRQVQTGVKDGETFCKA